MARPSYALLIVILALLSGVWTAGEASQSNQVNDSGLNNVVTVELTVGKAKIFHRYRVPFIEKSKRQPVLNDPSGGACVGSTGACDKDTGCEYCFLATADLVAPDRFLVEFWTTFKDRGRCGDSGSVLLTRGKVEDKKLKCGGRIRVYYGLEPPVKNQR